ncbi:butyrophilin subfamily 2 member A2-like isoform X4 [Dasypus novemcinctus]|uniref:butyrophilin subfamily 2 member A2-like isoform X4 n=1 Tax=Dasypus novemcinctus TaxID=9361 RepID=UPI00265FD94C|nr:butyrophilin subfamily 2 member A2-like isoform X2 [Dasypus novemcinctus]
MVGESSMLHCHLSPEKSAEAMEVRWFRTHFSPAVLVYRDGQERPEEQMQQYHGRTSLEGAGLGRGHAALVIHNVTAHEDGNYRCYFQEGTSYDEAIVRLEVAGLGSKPLVEMKGQEDGGIRLECTSAGWYPQPHAVWRDPYGEVVPALEEAYTAGSDGLFTVALAVIIRDDSVRNMFCSINNTRLSQEVEAGIFIPESFMPSTSPWMVALAVILPTLILLMNGGVCLVKKLQKEKEVLAVE